MKKHGSIITAMLALCMLLFGSHRTLAVHNNYGSVEQAFKNGHVLLNISGNGIGHSGYCITMTICNREKDSCCCTLETGRRLHSADTGIQDMLVLASQDIKLAGRQTKRIDVFGFCCQRYNHAPGADSKYTIGRMANGSLYAVATFLSRHTNYSLSTIQSAVWTMSDNISFNSINAMPGEDIQPLLDSLAKIKGRTKPSFNIVSQGGKKRIEANLAYSLPNQSIVTISVYDRRGCKVTTCYEQLSVPDDYITPVSLSAEGWSKGQYSICVMSDSGVLLKKSFVL